LCLAKEGGNPPPTTGPAPPTIPSNCEVIANPVTTDVPSWINWQWAQFNRFFTCTLTVLLNKILAGINSVITFLRWQLLYAQSVLNKIVQWLGTDLIPWLSGNFANMANGRTTTIIQDNGGCHDVFCLLQSVITTVLQPVVSTLQNIVNLILSLISQVFTLALGIVSAFFTLIFIILDQLTGLFGQIIGFFSGLLAAFANSQPVPIPGIPACELDPRSNGICMGLWALENTVFSGEGALAIPLIIGYLSLELILWAVNTFRSTIHKAGQSL
jgi:hypothetical protein